VLDRIHGDYVHKRRVQVLSGVIAELLPSRATVLDVGCGDGVLASLIMEKRPDVQIQGIDTLVRSTAHIPVMAFDGTAIPYDDASFDLVMFVDVLHHTDDPMTLLREGARVARQQVVVKDHNRDCFLGKWTLQAMDWVGNARHGVALPYNYWTRDHWENAFRTLDLRRTVNRTALGLYPLPADWIFGRDLHFLSFLEKRPDPALAMARAA